VSWRLIFFINLPVGAAAIIMTLIGVQEFRPPRSRRIDLPGSGMFTLGLVIWGQRDRYPGPELAEPDHDDVPNLDRVERLPDVSHWVHHDEAECVTQLLADFFAPTLLAKNR
jgi:hypothetical protein